jgi:hypothetical protein
LNGFSINGPGADSSKVGIGVSEGNVAINGRGIISGFQAGILKILVTLLISKDWLVNGEPQETQKCKNENSTAEPPPV